MSDRFDLKTFRPGKDKMWAHRIGSAWIDKNGNTQCSLDSLPIPDKDGQVRFFLEKRDPSKQTGQASSSSAPASSSGRNDDSDSIPF